MRRLLVASAALAFVGGAAAAAAPAGEPVFVVTGRGWGHGVGMGQWGARGFAARGWRYERILAHYYRGTRLGRAPLARVRVLIADGRARVRIGSKNAFRFVDARGQKATLRPGAAFLGPRLVVRRPGRKPLRLVPPIRFEPGVMPLRIDTKPYRGAFVVHRRRRLLSVVNDVPLELYLRGVVPWEMPHDWPLDALKAQAVVARSYALATMHPGQTYDLLDDTRDQVYGGLVAEKPESSRAIGATAGRVLLYGDRVATTYYHSTSGGRTASICDVWPKAPCTPYLQSVADPHETASPHHTWGPFVFTAGQLARKLKVAKPVDAVVERNASGRALAIALGGRRVGERAFRSALGLRSSWFQLGVMRLDGAPPATFGAAFELPGLVRGVRGATVERRDEGRWRPVARVRPAKDGRFTARVRALGSEFRISGGGAAAPPVRVRLAPKVVLRATAGGLRGVVRPALPRALVRIQLDVGGVWDTVASARVDKRGAFRVPEWVDPGRYRAWLGPTRGFLAAASRPLER
jgi:stage II sporulation protein D